jgi:uncharacterized SAM-binding protein YcdF (DUF218 family)
MAMTGPSAAQLAEAMDLVGAFCGPRDVASLTRSALSDAVGWEHADAIILFGGSILSGGDTMAAALAAGIATTSVIVGGQGHTTQALRDRASAVMPGADLTPATEADIFQRYLREVHGARADLLERESTNCGSNVRNAIRLLDEHGLASERVILIQDATMQRRMSAGWQRLRPDAQVLDYASYTASATGADGVVRYLDAPADMWPIERYASMLLGEIRRLRDDERGYGPRGTGWIAHVDIPVEVEEAAAVLSANDAFAPRPADPRWASDTR